MEIKADEKKVPCHILVTCDRGGNTMSGIVHDGVQEGENVEGRD